MRILIVSDTHGRLHNLNAAIEQAGKIDMMIHAGDVERQEDEIEELVECPVHMVAGNNDFSTPLPQEKEIQIGKYRVFITHGHLYCVSMHTDWLKTEAQERNANIVIYGHTHKPDIDCEGNVIAINPGSLTFPRQDGRCPTYIIMEINDAGEAEFTLYEL